MEDEIEIKVDDDKDEIKLKKKFEWKNLLTFDIKKDWPTLLIVAWIIYMSWAFAHETAECREIVNNPYPYCNEYCESIKGIDIGRQQGLGLPVSEGIKNFSFST